MPDREESIGINDRVALAEAEAIMKRRINKHHLKNGVTISDIDNTYIGPDVDIEQDAYIYPGTTITGNSSIKSDTVIGDRKSTRLNSSHVAISYAVFCLKKKKQS